MNNTGPTALPHDQETDHTRLMVEIEQHEDNGLRIPCRGPEGTLWLATNRTHQERAAETCTWCPARDACRAYALRWEEPAGVWGGMTTKARTTHLRATRNSPTRPAEPMETRKVA